MPLTPTGDIVSWAATQGCGLGAFNVVHIEHAEALVAAAEIARSPLMLQLSENTVRYHGGLKPIGVATLALAEAANAPIAVHLDHATDADLVRQAVQLGFTSVMFDGSTLPYGDNVAATAEVVEYCHARGVFVEAELGEIGGKAGAHASGSRTDPAEAQEFVSATRVDMLAVAVGSSHAMTERIATLDHDLISLLHDALPVPLVLHGSSGVADVELIRAVKAGITKVNIATRLNAVFTAAVRTCLAANLDLVDSRRYLAAARDAMTNETRHILGVLAA